MATLTKHPAKVGKASRVGKVHYWNGKPLPEIFHEDPEPVEDGMLQEETITKIVVALRRRFPQAFVKGDGFVMYDPENGNNRVAPDAYISFGVTRDYVQRELELPNYYTWVVDKMPEFALEVASPSTAQNDTDFKRNLYAELGIGEYWLLDRVGDLYGRQITGLRLVNGEYVEYEVHEEPDGSLWSYSELLELEFWWLSDASPFDPFDVRDPATGKSICVDAVIAEREETIRAERDARLVAERREQSERDARLVAERREQSERDARLAAERHERELLRRIERMEGRGD